MDNGEISYHTQNRTQKAKICLGCDKKSFRGKKKSLTTFMTVGRASSVVLRRERERESRREKEKEQKRERECVCVCSSVSKRYREREYIYKCLLKKKGGKGLEIS